IPMQNKLHYTNASVSIPVARHRGKRAFFLPVWRVCYFAGCLAVAWLTAPSIARSECREGCGIYPSNTFLGTDALTANFSGIENTAIGANALYTNTTGYFNTATGSSALYTNTTGS